MLCISALLPASPTSSASKPRRDICDFVASPHGPQAVLGFLAGATALLLGTEVLVAAKEAVASLLEAVSRAFLITLHSADALLRFVGAFFRRAMAADGRLFSRLLFLCVSLHVSRSGPEVLAVVSFLAPCQHSSRRPRAAHSLLAHAPALLRRGLSGGLGGLLLLLVIGGAAYGLYTATQFAAGVIGAATALLKVVMQLMVM